MLTMDVERVKLTELSDEVETSISSPAAAESASLLFRGHKVRSTEG